MLTTPCVGTAHLTRFPHSDQPFDVEAADAEASGCAAHHDPECLCDVDLNRVGIAPMLKVPHSVADYLDNPYDFVAWATRVAVTMGLGIEFDLACQARDEYEVSTTASELLTAIRNSIEAGLTLAQTVEFWAADVTSLMRRWANNPDIDRGERWLEAEALMSNTLIPYKHIGEWVGLSFGQVKRLSELLERGGRSPRRRHLDVLQVQARRMSANGMSAIVIAKHMTAEHGEFIGKGRVDGWLRADRRPQAVAV